MGKRDQGVSSHNRNPPLPCVPNEESSQCAWRTNFNIKNEPWPSQSMHVILFNNFRFYPEHNRKSLTSFSLQHIQKCPKNSLHSCSRTKE